MTVVALVNILLPVPVPDQFLLISALVMWLLEILSSRASFAPYFVKPDLSPDQRVQEKILLKERWILIQSGVERSDIKIKAIRISGLPHGHVVNSVFVPHKSNSNIPVSALDQVNCQQDLSTPLSQSAPSEGSQPVLTD